MREFRRAPRHCEVQLAVAVAHRARHAQAPGKAALDQFVDHLHVADRRVGRALGHGRQHLVLAVQLHDGDAGMAQAQFGDQEVPAQQGQLVVADVLRLGDDRPFVQGHHDGGGHREERAHEVVVGAAPGGARHAHDHVEPAVGALGVDLGKTRPHFLLDLQPHLAGHQPQHVGTQALELAQRAAQGDGREHGVVAHADAGVVRHPVARGRTQRL